MSRSKKEQNYIAHTNAVCVTVYSPDGSAISKSVQHEIEESVCQVALANRLLINIALT